MAPNKRAKTAASRLKAERCVAVSLTPFLPMVTKNEHPFVLTPYCLLVWLNLDYVHICLVA